MPDFHFPGYPAYIDAAAKAMARPIRMDGFAKVAPLVVLANLCSQAIGLNPSTMLEVLASAREFRDQIEVALAAADRMLADLDALRHSKVLEQAQPEPQPQPEPEPEPQPQPQPPPPHRPAEPHPNLHRPPRR